MELWVFSFFDMLCFQNVINCPEKVNMRNVAAEEKKIWHLCTPGESSGILFRVEEDYIYGMNMIGVSAAKFFGKIRIYTFQLMSNHLHFVIDGEQNDIEEFFYDFILRLRRYMLKQARAYDINQISHSIIPVKDENYLKNLIAYVNRNGYLVNKNMTQFSYPWGANRYFFFPLAEIEPKIYLSKMANRKKMEMFHTREINFPDHFYLTNGYISPNCYCQIKQAEELYMNAHHYSSLVSRRVESFVDIAAEIGDTITYSDEEMYVSIFHHIKKQFDKSSIQSLSKMEKLQVAKIMHYEYNSSNKQISRILRLDIEAIDALFPQRAKSL